MFSNASILHKVQKQLNWRGTTFVFQHPAVNEYGEKIADYSTFEVKGIFHESTNLSTEHIVQTGQDAALIPSKHEAMIYALWDEARLVSSQDVLQFNGKKYTVTSVDNIQELNKVAEISLEEVV